MSVHAQNLPNTASSASAHTKVFTLAGAPKQAGSIDGGGTEARFKRPMGIAIAPNGVVYIADTENHTIRRITPAGAVTTLAGTAGSKGSLDGSGEAARFYHPVGIALDSQGNLYVTDSENHTIRKINSAGLVTTLVGTAGRKGISDGAGIQASFNYPHGIAVGADGTIYVTDTENHTIRQISSTGVVTTLAGSAGKKGAPDGTGAAALFYHPSGIAVTAEGILYVADNGNHTVRKISRNGAVTTLAGMARKRGHADGTGPAARFDWPNGVAVDSQGLVYVADNVNSIIRIITPTGVVTTLVGKALSWGSQDGNSESARFEFPFGVAVNPSGNIIYVTDTKNQTIRRIQRPPL
ncbi:hypothetical protein KBK19_08655 [Microvirga sp. STR05]|uniref:Teneurin NHL domain-containing protein n=1 Tax=Hymenobacter duratus TaxID=2771356 RepID=A0ABR8JE21_9BACT|nr:NHL repeat-containing protein [Hymenobacter duratus]MBD2715103.1 hypothetical protein [Hymenobacter duratus]MBR7950009.1 hypothetical protein [Microvirga sp. STR05]